MLMCVGEPYVKWLQRDIFRFQHEPISIKRKEKPHRITEKTFPKDKSTILIW